MSKPLPEPNTLAMRRISHALVEAWEGVQLEGGLGLSRETIEAMHNAMDAIIAAYTPGYNAESMPDLPEEYIPGTRTPTEDSERAWAEWEKS